MTRRIATIALALFTVFAVTRPSDAQPRRGRLSEVVNICEGTPGVRLVTMGVGSLMWERHGHIALCTCSANPREDACYNYGIGDFRHPVKMAWGFFRAADSFWVGKQDPREMIAVYQWADRTVWVQPLPLTPEQEKKVSEKLEFYILEPNKHYSYDHFWDNCTTRVRDIIDDATGGELSKMTASTDGRTFRDLAREGFVGMPYSRIALVITDLGMGRVTDRVPSYWERMFLPDYLREAVYTKWNIEPKVLYQRKGALSFKELEKALADPTLTPERKRELQAQLDALESAAKSNSGRFLFALLVLVLTAPAWVTRLWGRFQRVGLAVAVIPPALLGVVFWGLAIVSRLPYVRWNETALCFVPFDILLLALPPRLRQRYARGRVIMLLLVAALLLVDVLKAPVWPALLWSLIPNAVVGFWPERRT